MKLRQLPTGDATRRVVSARSMLERFLQWFILVLSRWLSDIQKRRAEELLGAARSPLWRKVREEHLRKYQTCALCGGREVLEVHHIESFSRNPSRELDPANLITLCESGKNGVVCHRFFGHLGNYQSINPTCEEDVKRFSEKIKNRP